MSGLYVSQGDFTETTSWIQLCNWDISYNQYKYKLSLFLQNPDWMLISLLTSITLLLIFFFISLLFKYSHILFSKVENYFP